MRPSRASSSSSAGPRMPGPTVTRDDGTSSDRTDDIRRQVQRDRRPVVGVDAGQPADDARAAAERDDDDAQLAAGGQQRGGLLGGAGQHDGVRGVGGVALAAAEQVEVALAAGPAQPRLPVGADVLLAEQLHEPGAGLVGQPGRRQRDVGDGDRRGRPGRPAQLLRQVAAGGLGHRAAQVVGARWRCCGAGGPQPWIVSSGCSGTATVCRCCAGAMQVTAALPGTLSPGRRARTSPTSPGPRSTSWSWAAG